MKKRIAFYGFLILAGLGAKIYLDSGACEIKKQLRETQEEVSRSVDKISKILGTKAAGDHEEKQMDWLICLPL